MRNSVSIAALSTAVVGGIVLALTFLPAFLATEPSLAPATAHAAEVITSTSSPLFAPSVDLEQSIVQEKQKRAIQKKASGPVYPTRITIPSIALNAPVIPVGKNSKGEMDVPSGTSNDVGWYKYGTKPGDRGMAVLDAHVYAALKNLRYAKIGDDIYIAGTDGARLHFKITHSIVYTLSELTPQMLFGSNGKREINIITCAGTYIPSRGTYDHRLVVTAELVD